LIAYWAAKTLAHDLSQKRGIDDRLHPPVATRSLDAESVTIPVVFRTDQPELKVEFPVKNDTENPIRFVRVRRGCDCLDTALAKDYLEPGGETVLTTIVNCRDRIGPQSITTWLDDDQGWSRAYRLKTTIYDSASFAESRAFSFGILQPNRQASKTLELRLFGKTQEDLPRLKSLKPQGTRYVRLTHHTPVVEQDQNGVFVAKIGIVAELSTPGDVADGYVSVVAALQCGDKSWEVKSDGFWQMKAPFTAEPAQVIWKQTSLSKPSDRRSVVKVQSDDGRPFRLKAVRGLPPGVTCEFDSQLSQNVHQITFVVQKESLRTATWSQVAFTTQAGVESEFYVPVVILPGHSKHENNSALQQGEK
jgi:hypothetical protein